MRGGRGTEKYTLYLAFDTARFFFAFKLAVELAHARRATARHRERAFYLSFSLG